MTSLALTDTSCFVLRSLRWYYVNAWDINEAKSKGVGLSRNKKCEKIPDLSTNKIVTD